MGRVEETGAGLRSALQAAAAGGRTQRGTPGICGDYWGFGSGIVRAVRA